MLADLNLNCAPGTSPLDKIASDRVMKVTKKVAIKRLIRKGGGLDLEFHSQYALGEEGRELEIAQDALFGLKIAGGAAWRCSSSSHERLTGSPSKAMDSATFCGMRRQRRATRSASGSARQRARVCFQSMC